MKTVVRRLLFKLGELLFDAGIALMALSFDEEWQKVRR